MNKLVDVILAETYYNGFIEGTKLAETMLFWASQEPFDLESFQASSKKLIKDAKEEIHSHILVNPDIKNSEGA